MHLKPVICQRRQSKCVNLPCTSSIKTLTIQPTSRYANLTINYEKKQEKNVIWSFQAALS